MYSRAVLGAGYLFICEMPQRRRVQLFLTEIFIGVTVIHCGLSE